MNFDKICDDVISEGWKDWLAAGMIGGAALGTPAYGQSVSPQIQNYIQKHEGVENYIYRDSKGKLTIGIGHLITNNDRQLFKKLFGSKVNFDKILSKRQGLTKQQISRLFNHDIQAKLSLTKRLFPKYDRYPDYVKAALLDGVYRGDLSGSPRTRSLINNGKWEQAAKEYLNHKEYRKAKATGSGVASRMEQNRDMFLKYAKEQR